MALKSKLAQLLFAAVAFVALLVIQAAPALPADDDGSVDEHDALHGGVHEVVEVGGDAVLQLGPASTIGGVLEGVREHGAQLVLEAAVDGLEEITLVAEVIVERAAGDARGLHDVLGRRAGVAVSREELARDTQQRGARRLRLLRLAPPGDDCALYQSAPLTAAHCAAAVSQTLSLPHPGHRPRACSVRPVSARRTHRAMMPPPAPRRSSDGRDDG